MLLREGTSQYKCLPLLLCLLVVVACNFCAQAVVATTADGGGTTTTTTSIAATAAKHTKTALLARSMSASAASARDVVVASSSPQTTTTLRLLSTLKKQDFRHEIIGAAAKNTSSSSPWAKWLAHGRRPENFIFHPKLGFREIKFTQSEITQLHEEWRNGSDALTPRVRTALRHMHDLHSEAVERALSKAPPRAEQIKRCPDMRQNIHPKCEVMDLDSCKLALCQYVLQPEKEDSSEQDEDEGGETQRGEDMTDEIGSGASDDYSSATSSSSGDYGSGEPPSVPQRPRAEQDRGKARFRRAERSILSDSLSVAGYSISYSLRADICAHPAYMTLTVAGLSKKFEGSHSWYVPGLSVPIGLPSYLCPISKCSVAEAGLAIGVYFGHRTGYFIASANIRVCAEFSIPFIFSEEYCALDEEMFSVRLTEASDCSSGGSSSGSSGGGGGTVIADSTCSYHSSCASDEYCDKNRRCWTCADCAHYDDAYNGQCPSKCNTLKDPGSRCTANAQCKGNRCMGGYCCGTKGLTNGCTRCDFDGDCTSCQSPFSLENYACVDNRRDAGESCSADSQCHTGDCRGGSCCNVLGQTRGCTRCNAEGTCFECQGADVYLSGVIHGVSGGEDIVLEGFSEYGSVYGIFDGLWVHVGTYKGKPAYSMASSNDGLKIYYIPSEDLGSTVGVWALSDESWGSTSVYAYSRSSISPPERSGHAWLLGGTSDQASWIPTGKCAPLRDPGESCVFGDICAGDTCRGFSCCSAKGRSAGCTQCSSNNGDCTACSSGYYLSPTRHQCYALKAAGETCQTHGAIQCASGSCKNGYCCGGSGKVNACSSCSSSGDCATCTSGYWLSSGQCRTKISNGGSCSAGSQCASGSCKGGRCCSDSGKAGACSSCSSSGGICALCASGYWLSSGQCRAKSADGGACSASTQCRSGSCKGNRCCGANGKTAGCSSCSSSGGCATCTSGYWLSGSKCASTSGTGDTCSVNDQCGSGSCKGGFCCGDSGKVSACSSCSSSGDCALCASGYWLSSGQCQTKSADGAGCRINAGCTSGSCKGGFCCGNDSGRDSACASCSSQGTCALCSSSHWLSSGQCKAKGTNGANCRGDGECSSGSCKGGYCCGDSGKVSECNSCSSAGSCEQCANDYWLSNAQCNAKKANGASCRVGIECGSGICKGGYCCGDNGNAAACSTCTNTGSCARCSSSHWLSSGQCKPKSINGASCIIDAQCTSASCKGGFCCGDNGSAGACTSCSSSSGGDCSQCASGFWLSRSGLCKTESEIGDGCSGNIECASGFCKGGRCCGGVTGTASGCSACSQTGDCAQCAGGYWLSNSTCTPTSNVGDSCSADTECGSSSVDPEFGSGTCKGGFCCAENGKANACTVCTSTGDCAQCATGYWLSGGQCKVKSGDGDSCASGAECISGACKGGNCCDDRGKADSCSSCSGNGDCAFCKDDYWLSGNQCKRKSEAGASCSEDAQCGSGLCKEGYCCGDNGKVPACYSCTSSGNCAECAAGYELTDGVCGSISGGGAGNGDLCNADVECDSGSCKGGRCCGDNGRAVACLACADTGGDCAQCTAGYELSYGVCKSAGGEDKDVGVACNAAAECASGSCKGGYCCGDNGKALACLACSSTGDCLQCRGSGSVLSDGQCQGGGVDGSSCGADDECASGTCKGGFCCGNNGKSGACNSCSGNGDCTQCTGSFWLHSGQCKMKTSEGGSCNANSQCSSDSCKGGYCCGENGKAAACSACSSTGSCLKCTRDHYLLPERALCTPIMSSGAICSDDGASCASGLCRGGRCCSDSGVGLGCSSCSDSGTCTECSTGYWLLPSGQCKVTGIDGATCSNNAGCDSGSCKSNRCCGSNGITSTCSSCSDTGDCSQCSIGFRLKGGLCEAMAGVGDKCSDAAVCDGSFCKGGKCCKVDTDENCSQCGDYGNCVACGESYDLRDGTCVKTSAAVDEGGIASATGGAANTGGGMDTTTIIIIAVLGGVIFILLVVVLVVLRKRQGSIGKITIATAGAPASTTPSTAAAPEPQNRFVGSHRNIHVQHNPMYSSPSDSYNSVSNPVYMSNQVRRGEEEKNQEGVFGFGTSGSGAHEYMDFPEAEVGYTV